MYENQEDAKVWIGVWLVEIIQNQFHPTSDVPLDVATSWFSTEILTIWE